MRALLTSLLAFVLGGALTFAVLSRTGVPVPAPSTPPPETARQAWLDFTQRMAVLGDRIVGSDFPDGEEARV